MLSTTGLSGPPCSLLAAWVYKCVAVLDPQSGCADVLPCPFPPFFLQAEHARRLVARGVGVISREAPAYRKAKTDPPHFTAEGIQALVQEVRLGWLTWADVPPAHIEPQLPVWVHARAGTDRQ